MALARFAVLALLLALAGCGSKDYAAPSWEVAGPWEPANSDTVNTDNNLVPRPGYVALRRLR